jgi:hypothetical protein
MEVPDLVELQKKYQDRLQVIGLVVDDADEDAVRKFAKRYAINYELLSLPLSSNLRWLRSKCFSLVW